MPMPTLLYVEDDINLSFVTCDNLGAAGFTVVHCPSGAKAWALFQTDNQQFDLCLLDVMLPETDGFTLARNIRATNADVPILFLSARVDHTDRLTGLRLGGDDYLTKPYRMDELLLKIEVFLKRSKTTRPTNLPLAPPYLVLGSYQFDKANLVLRSAGQTHSLTQREADVLAYLLARANTVVRRDELLRSLWGDDDYFMGRSLDVFISRLRKRLTDDSSIRIEGVHGVGFRLTVGI